MSTNVNDYTSQELMDIIGITSMSEDNIVNACDSYINDFTDSYNDEIVSFFQDIQQRLLDEIAGDEEDDEEEGENKVSENVETTQPPPVGNSSNAMEWYGTQYLQENDNQPISKITERENKIRLFDNDHLPMTREQLGILNNFQVKVGQDTLNPTLQNTMSRYIVIDSQFRQASSGDGYTLNTDFTLDLSEHMVNVLSLRLSAIQIPYSWFNINTHRNYFYIYNKENNNDMYYRIEIDEGNYDTIDEVVTAIHNSFVSTGFNKTGSVGSVTDFIYISNGKIVIDLYDTTTPSGSTIHCYDDTTSGNTGVSGIFFYPLQEPLSNVCLHTKTQQNQFDYENTLGWLLGYRKIAEYVYINGNVAEALYKLNTVNYLILIIDDFNQNHINNGIVNITELSNRIPRNKYNTSNNPYYCIKYKKEGDKFDPIKILDISLLNAPLSVIAEKIIPPYNDIVHVLPSAPRTLTQSQIYATNEIAKANAQTTRYKSSPPSNSDTFAIFPFSTKGAAFGSLITETGSTLQLNQRVYFGPVNLDRLRVRLLDDKGNLMDFNGLDWNIVIIADCLYQY
jgi:hypothetical protein